MVSSEKQSKKRGVGRGSRTKGRSSVTTGVSKRRGKKAGKATKMPSARNPNRSKAKSGRTSSARTVAPTTRNRGKGGDEEE